jgi:hypothetical protein
LLGGAVVIRKRSLFRLPEVGVVLTAAIPEAISTADEAPSSAASFASATDTVGFP